MGLGLVPGVVATLSNTARAMPTVDNSKAASGTTEEVSQLRLLCGERLAIYSGDDALTLPMLAVGAVGVVSVASHLAGPRLQQLFAITGLLAAVLLACKALGL